MADKKHMASASGFMQLRSGGRKSSAGISTYASCLIGLTGQSGMDVQLSPAEKSIVTIIANHPGIRSGELSVKLSIPAPTMKRMVSGLLQKGLLQKHGNGRSTNYSVA